MNRQAILVMAVLVCLAVPAQAKSADNTTAPTITVTKLEVADKILKLDYQIGNNTKHDLWIFEGLDEHDISAEVFMEEATQTLLLRSRLDVPMAEPPRMETPSFDGAYARLPSGGTLSESICMCIPVKPLYWYGGAKQQRGLEFTSRLAIEIGYYSGDLPEIIRTMLTSEKDVSREIPLVRLNLPKTLFEWFEGLGLLRFNEMNESVGFRDEQVLLPYTDRILKGEQSTRVTIDGLHIPYCEERYDPSISHDPPDLTSCTKLEIRYYPSMLEYYFPYAGQRSLLSQEETRYLRTVRRTVCEDTADLKALVSDIGSAMPTISGVIRQQTVAHVVGYNGSEQLLSIPIYNNSSLVDSEMSLFTHDDGFPSLKLVSPYIERLSLRMQCATNLKNLWHRLRFYHDAEGWRLKKSFGENETLYPSATQWCDAMVPAYKSIGMVDYWVLKPYRCPSAGEGKCSYAMNPNCRPDSPADTVLLFETKAGWNQHGGPELFTFDNHDPKGGCVLLNDGTVKFIRTAEELQRLRWK